ncbi:MAG TPA: DUF2269 family protein [Ktedonobacterales bacterium]|nr:DUF2269 family protein [Ktedonobacterales bacterium]
MSGGTLSTLIVFGGQTAVVLLAVINSTLKNILFILHVLSAVYFALGAVLATVFTLQVPNTPTLTAKARVMGNNSRVARMVIIPGALLAGLSGLVLAYVEGPNSFAMFHNGWVIISLALFVAALVLGGVSGPLAAKLRQRVETEARSGKRPSADLVKALKAPTPYILTGVNLLITVALVVLMFTKKP